MDSPAESSDPWDWTPEEVTKHLCSPLGPLRRTFLKAQDLQALSNALEENIVHGQDLLISVDDAKLKDELKLSAIGKRSNVLYAIKTLQKQSPKYQEWKLENNEGTDKAWGSQYHSIPPSATSPWFLSNNTPFERFVREPMPTPERQAALAVVNGYSNGNSADHTPRQFDSPRIDVRTALPPVPDGFSRSGVAEDRNHPRRKASLDIETGQETADNADSALRATKAYVQDEGGRKRRKLGPNDLQLISKPAEKSSPANDHASNARKAAIEGAASIGQNDTTQSVDENLRSGLLGGHMGSKAVPVNHVFYPNTALNSVVYHPVYLNQKESDAISRDQDILHLSPEPSTVFKMKHPGPIGNGLKRYISTRMKRFLLESNANQPTIVRHDREESYGIVPYSERLLRYAPAVEKYSITLFGKGGATRVDGSQWKRVDFVDSLQSDPNDLDNRLEWWAEQGDNDSGEALPLYGESDSEEGYDSDTWRQIEEENEERRQIAAAKSGIDKGRVVAVLDECIAAYRQRWENEKLPQLQDKAWRIWTSSRKKATVKWEIRGCNREIERFDDRLSVLRTEMEIDSWVNDDQVRKSSASLEFTLKDLWSAEWKLQVLREPLPPPRPGRKPRRPAKKAVRSVPSTLQDDEEELVSEEDEDHLSDFVDDDDDDQGRLENIDVAGVGTETSRHSAVQVPVSQDKDAATDVEREETRQKSPVQDPIAEDANASVDVDMEGTHQQSPSQLPAAKNKDAVDLDETNRQSPVLEAMNTAVEVDKETRQSSWSEAMNLDAWSDGGSEQSLVPARNEASKIRSPSPPPTAAPAEEPILDPSPDESTDSLLESDDGTVNRETAAKPTQLSTSVEVIDLTELSDNGDQNHRKSSLNAPSSDLTPLETSAISNTDIDETCIKTEPGVAESDSTSIPDPRNIAAYMNLSSRQRRAILKRKQPENLLMFVIGKTSLELRKDVGLVLEGKGTEAVAVAIFEALEVLKKHGRKMRNVDEKTSKGLLQLATWFVVWSCRTVPKSTDGIEKNHIDEALEAVGAVGPRFDKFFELVTTAVLWSRYNDPNKTSSTSSQSTPIFPIKKPELPSDPQKKPSGTSHGKKRGRPIKESQEGIDLREGAQKRAEARKQKSKALQSKHPLIGTRSNQPAMINPMSNEEDFIFINPHIGKTSRPHTTDTFANAALASLIHSHQIEGVRFLWDEIVTAREGCLLAHTMGLGKTMQCITLLLTMAEASKSPKPGIRDQVPPELREARVLIVAPPSLLENWSEELSKWIPEPSEDSVGFTRLISPAMRDKERLYELQLWADSGGIVLISYYIMESLVVNRKRKRATVPFTDSEHEELQHLLLERPSIVIADEAQTFKNPDSSVSRVMHRIRTKSRVALTGSPLSNNLIEYFSIVNWVQESYLGGKAEFQGKFVSPISEGLYQDSKSWEKRKSLKMLEVLKRDLEPKVLRADYSVLKGQMKGKTEFLLRVPLTDIQSKCYALYIDSIKKSETGKTSSARLWAWLAILRLLCNHPACFYAKLKDRDKNPEIKDSATSSPKNPSGSRGQSPEMDAEADQLLSQPVTTLGLEPTMVDNQLLELEAIAGDISAIELSHKIEILMDIIRFSEEADEKVLVFSQSIPTLDYVGKQLKGSKIAFLRLDGSLHTTKRQKLTREYNEGKMKVLLISTRAGDTGINLQSASRVIILDDSWNPMHEQQAIGRSYRIGQAKHVYVYRLVISGSFEEALQNQSLFKLQLATRVVDKKDIVRRAQKDVRQYIKHIQERDQEDLTPFKGKDALVLDRLLSIKASLVRSIQLAETFMEEETEELTAEEAKEVRELGELERLRRTNPEEYGRKLMERQRPSFVPGQRNDSFGASLGPSYPTPALTMSVPSSSFQQSNISRSSAQAPVPPTNPRSPQERVEESAKQQQSLVPVLGAGTNWVPQSPVPADIPPSPGNHGKHRPKDITRLTAHIFEAVFPQNDSPEVQPPSLQLSKNKVNEELKAITKAARLQAEQEVGDAFHTAISAIYEKKDAAPLPKDARALADRYARRTEQTFYALADCEILYYNLVDQFPFYFERRGEQAIRQVLANAKKEEIEQRRGRSSSPSLDLNTRSPLISRENEGNFEANGQPKQREASAPPKSNRSSAVQSPAPKTLGEASQSNPSKNVGSTLDKSSSCGFSISSEFPSLSELLKNETNRRQSTAD